MKISAEEIDTKSPLNNALILKFTVGYPVKFTDSRLKEEQRTIDSYVIMIAKVNDEWHTYNNAISSYGEKISSEFARGIQKAYDNLKLDAEVVFKDNIIETKLPAPLGGYLDSLANQKGVIIEETVVRESDSAYLLFYFTDDNYEFISQNTMQLLIELNGIGEIIYMGPLNYEGDIPYFYDFAQRRGVQTSKFRLIHTKWEFKGNEVNEENDGIFSNRGLFYAKYFGKDKVNLILAQHSEEKLGAGKCDKIEVNGENMVYECVVDSSWFSDLYDNIVSRKVGPVSMWWVSDGSTCLDNYYIIYDRSSTAFLYGMKQLYRMEQRKNHRNILAGSRILKE